MTSMRVNKTIAISESGMLFNPVTGESYSTNEIGLRILKLLNEGLAVNEIIEKLVSEYNVDAELSTRDVSDYLDMLRHYNLLKDYGQEKD